MHWELLISEEALAAVLPATYRHYLRPVQGGLIVFLENLPAAEQGAVLMDQASLPADAKPGQRLARLAQSCPALHKLGQTLARDHRLKASFRRHLRPLESLPPSLPFPTLAQLLARELGPLDRLGVTLVPPALAEASVAVVVAFEADRPVGRSGLRHGVFKLLKPGIEDRLECELAQLPRVGTYLDEQCDDLKLPPLDYRESLEQVRDKLRQEIRLDLEQRHLRQAAALYRDDSAVQIPELLAPCTARVTAMERVFGRKITECRRGNLISQGRAAEIAVSALIARPIFAEDPRTFFHADPHAGNLFVTDEGRLAILDWSLVGYLTEGHRVAITQVIFGALLLQPWRVGAALEGLSERGRLDRAALEPVVGSWLQRVRRGGFPGMTWLVGLLDDAVQTAGLRVPADLLLFRRAYHALQGVVGDLGATERVADMALARAFVGALAREWPRRWWMPATSRTCLTRLSNVDLAEWMVEWPWSAMEVWLERSRNAG